MNIADMAIETYIAESSLLRVLKLIDQRGMEACSLQVDLIRTYLNDAVDKLHKSGRDALAGFATGDELKMMLMGLKRFTKTEPFNTKAARRRIAEKMIAENKYCF